MATNKVVLGNETLIDITDTTATRWDVLSGKYFYLASGARTTGRAVEAQATVSNETLSLTDGFPINTVIEMRSFYVSTWMEDEYPNPDPMYYPECYIPAYDGNSFAVVISDWTSQQITLPVVNGNCVFKIKGAMSVYGNSITLAQESYGCSIATDIYNDVITVTVTEEEANVVILFGA